MASFALVYANELDTGVTTSQDTSESTTPAVGDVFFFGGDASAGTGVGVSDAGSGTWTQRGSTQVVGAAFLAAFECTGGSPSGAITVTASDNFRDLTYALVRPSDADFSLVAGQDAATTDALTTTLSTSPADNLLAYGFTRAPGATFTTDSGWTQLDQGTNGSGNSQQVQYRLSDDSEVIFTADATNDLGCICLEFSDAAGGLSIPVAMATYRRRRS